MERVKMFMSVIVALALLSFFFAPMVQAQDGKLKDTVHDMKLNASAVSVFGGGVADFFIERTGGKVAGPVVLRQVGPNGVTGGFNYEIYVLIGEELSSPPFCNEEPIGTLTTYNSSENIAFGTLIPNVDLEVPELGLILYGNFFAQVKIKTGKSSFKSVAGWAEVEVAAGFPGAGDPDPDGMSKKFGVKAKEKTLEKLGLECQLNPAP